jgi:hypothetical protein
LTNNFLFIKEADLNHLTFKSVLNLSKCTFEEIKNQLKLDAINQSEYVGEVKVTEALQESLKTLQSLHPVIESYLQSHFKPGALN